MPRTKQKARRKSNQPAKQVLNVPTSQTVPTAQNKHKKISNQYAMQMAIPRKRLADNQELASIEIKESMECPLDYLADCKHKKSCTCVENWKLAWDLYGLDKKSDDRRRQKWFGVAIV